MSFNSWIMITPWWIHMEHLSCNTWLVIHLGNHIFLNRERPCNCKFHTLHVDYCSLMHGRPKWPLRVTLRHSPVIKPILGKWYKADPSATKYRYKGQWKPLNSSAATVPLSPHWVYYSVASRAGGSSIVLCILQPWVGGCTHPENCCLCGGGF